MITYRYSTPADFDSILDVANRIFSLRTNEDESEHYDRGYFRTLQPKLYRSAEVMPPHLMAFDGDTLVGIAALCVHPLHMGGQTVTVGGVGTVGVLQDYRGRGIMRELMTRLNSDMARDGVTLGELGGKRSRYAHFGYFSGGAGMEISLSRDDILPFPTDGLTVAELSGEAMVEEVQLFRSLYDRTPIRAERSETDFVSILRSGKRRPYRILHGNRTVGYLCADAGLDQISEIELDEPSLLLNALHAWFNEVGSRSLLLYGIAPAERDKLAMLLPIATSAKLAERERYKIFDHRGLIEAGLRARAELSGLACGEARFAITGYGTLTVSVGKTVEVTRSDEACEVTLTEEEATRLLIGLPSPCGFCGKALSPLLTAWFPLPLHDRPCDRV